MNETIKSSVDQIAEAIRMLQESSTQIFDDMERLRKELSQCDLELSDIMHFAEFATFNAAEGYNIAKELKIASERRRKVKNELEVLQAVKQSVSDRKQQILSLSSVVKKVENAKARQGNKVYTPRVRVEMFEKLKGK